MSLKFPFKFKHSAHSPIFTARRKNGFGLVEVSWLDGYGTYHIEDYGIISVMEFIQNNEWFVIAEETTSPTVEITQAEYDSMVEEINLLQELLAEVFTTQPQEQFKPIKDMTLDDWVQAEREEWVFELRCGAYTKVDKLDPRDTKWKVATKFGWNRIDGSYTSDYEQHDYDIIKRVA